MRFKGPLAESYWSAVALLGAAFALGVFLAAARLERPDLETWMAGEGQALHSPPLGGEGRSAARGASAERGAGA